MLKTFPVSIRHSSSVYCLSLSLLSFTVRLLRRHQAIISILTSSLTLYNLLYSPLPWNCLSGLKLLVKFACDIFVTDKNGYFLVCIVVNHFSVVDTLTRSSLLFLSSVELPLPGFSLNPQLPSCFIPLETGVLWDLTAFLLQSPVEFLQVVTHFLGINTICIGLPSRSLAKDSVA